MPKIHWTLKERKMMSEKIKKIALKKGFGKWMLGRKFSIETKKKMSESRKGKKSPGWKGGKWKDKNGYIYIYCPGHPNAVHKGKYIFEHRLMMEKHLGRYLTKEEVVHHINGIRDDNRIENLRLYENNVLHLKDDENWKKSIFQKGHPQLNTGRTHFKKNYKSFPSAFPPIRPLPFPHFKVD